MYTEKITGNIIREYKKEEFNLAFNEIKNKKDTYKHLSKKVKNLVFYILKFSREFNLDIKSNTLSKDLLLKFKTSDNLNYVGIGYLVEDIIGTGLDNEMGLKDSKQLEYDIETMIGNKLVVFLELKNFKDIYSLYGHKDGNVLLAKIKDKLEKDFGELGFELYKIGPLSFGLLVACSSKKCSSCKMFRNNKGCGLGTNDTKYDISRIKELLSDFYIDFFGQKLKVNFYGGVAYKNNVTYDNVLHALYYSYKKGKLVVYSKEMEEEVVKESKNKIEWGNKIIEGLKKDYFIPYYQGIRDNNTGEINKYESLIRYKNGTEFYTPWYFLEIAEELNLLSALSERMVSTVIREMSNHNKSVSINLTEEDFLNTKITDLILNLLYKYNIKPNRLIVEVLENITEEENNNIICNINRLKEIGVLISIDDFGSRHSNFSRLLNISPNFLKIDGSLIKGLMTEEKNKYIKILKAIIEFGHSQGAKIIAEYVENIDIQRILEKLGVDYSQGYYFSKPGREIIKK